MDGDLHQIVRVNSHEINSDEFGGPDWETHYVLYRGKDDEGREQFYLYDDDGHGNGTEIAQGTSLKRMRSLTLRLGDFVEWAPGVGAINP